MPIRVPDNLPALDDLTAEGVDLIASGQATKQDIRPLRLIMLNLMPTKKQRKFNLLDYSVAPLYKLNLS